MYKGGFPTFSIEKPMSVPWKSKVLMDTQMSDKYMAELKLNEHRGFLCIDESGKASFHSHRGPSTNSPINGLALEYVESLNLPKSSIFDAGHFSRKEFSNESRIWLMDILLIDGQKVRLPHAERVKLRDQLFKQSKYVWIPLSTTNFLIEFQNMLKGSSPLIRQASEVYAIPYEILVKEIEGLVIKMNSGLHSFPVNKKEVPEFLKLKIVDVFDKSKDWVSDGDNKLVAFRKS